METGGLLVLLAGRGVLCPLICCSIHKGLIWLLVAIIAEIPLVVSGLFLVPALSIHCEFMSQVFICLNLNGRFLLCPFCQRRTLMIGLDSARNIRSIQPGKFSFVIRVV